MAQAPSPTAGVGSTSGGDDEGRGVWPRRRWLSVLRGAGLALVQLRSYDRADADRIRAMSARLSPHSMYRRFFNGTPELEDARVEAARARQRVGMLRRLGVERLGWTSVDRRPDLDGRPSHWPC